MSVRAEAEVLIRRPPEVVEAFLLDPANDPLWISGVKEGHWVTDPPLDVGSRIERTASFLGRRFTYELLVEGYEPGAYIVYSAVAGPLDMRVRFRYTAENGVTRLAMEIQGEAAGFFGLASPVLAPALRRTMQNDLLTLQQLLEADGAPTGPG